MVNPDGRAQVDVANIGLPTALYNGKTVVATAGTRVALTTTLTLQSGVTVKALAANTGIIYLGNATVASTNGFQLSVGEEKFVEIDDPAKIYIDASVSGEGVSWEAT
jgi:hypothetical protein